MPQMLQDPERAADTRAAFDELMSTQITDEAFVDFERFAHEQAVGSILAASVFDLIRFAREHDTDAATVPGSRRKLLRSAEAVADQVETLDAFLRSPANADELVLYTDELYHTQGRIERGRATGLYLSVARDSHLVHHPPSPNPVDPNAPDKYYLEPVLAFGAQPTNIENGRFNGWIQGSNNYFDWKNRDLDNLRKCPRFHQMLWFSYAELALPTYWPPTTSLPRITIGNDQVMDLFERQLEEDYQSALTENYSRRPSFALWREAHFLGSPLSRTMFEVAAEKHILPEWQRQVLDEDAIFVVTCLEQAARDSVPDSTIQKRLRFGSAFEMRDQVMDMLGLKLPQYVERAEQRAMQRGLDVPRTTLESSLAISLHVSE